MAAITSLSPASMGLMRLPVWNASWSTAERSVGSLMAMVITSLRPDPVTSYANTCSRSATERDTVFTARGSIFTSESRTAGMPRCWLRAEIICSSRQNSFCTRMTPSLPPHCFWWPSALCSWCSSMTFSSVRSCPSRFRGGIPISVSALHAREVLFAREDALLDEQLDHRLARRHRAPLGLFHSAQHLQRAGPRRLCLLRSGGLGLRLLRLDRDHRVPAVVDDLHRGVVAAQLLAAVPARDRAADGGGAGQLRLDAAAGQRAQVVGDHHVAGVAHRDHQRAALVLEREGHQVELFRRLGGDVLHGGLVRLAGEVGAGDAGLLRERADQHLLGDELHPDQDVAQLAAPLRLLREGRLELEIGDHACLDERVAYPDPHAIILGQPQRGQQLSGPASREACHDVRTLKCAAPPHRRRLPLLTRLRRPSLPAAGSGGTRRARWVCPTHAPSAAGRPGSSPRARRGAAGEASAGRWRRRNRRARLPTTARPGEIS